VRQPLAPLSFNVMRRSNKCEKARFGNRLPAEALLQGAVPPIVRELISTLERAGFKNRGGKGSHRNYVHPDLSKPLTISVKLGDDAKQYQVHAVKRALEELAK